MSGKNWLHMYGGPIASPVNVRLGAGGEAVPEATWIQLPGVAGDTVTFVDGNGDTQTITSTATANTWGTSVRSITSSSGIVTLGSGPLPPNVVTGASAIPSLSLSATVITANPAPAIIDTLYLCNPSGAAFNVGLPAIAAGNHNHRVGFRVTTTSANAVTPVPAGSDALDAGVTTVAGAYGFLILQADNVAKVWRKAG